MIKYEYFVSIIFIVVLLIPFLLSFANKNISISSTEKRKLAEFPDLSLSFLFLNSFPKQFEAYYEDHFGFRDIIIRLHNYTLCKIFRISPNEQVIVGAEGWYFFNADGAISDYLGRIKYSKTQLEQVKYVLENRSEWLHSLGIRYLYLPVPNKESVYDEYLPLILRKNKGYDSYSQILDYLSANNTAADFINTKQVLLNGKTDLQLYFRTDSHWNHDGAYLIYRSIIAKMQQWFPDIKPLRTNNEKQWIHDFSGDLAILMNLKGLVTETAPARNFIEVCKAGALKRWDQVTELPEYSHLSPHQIPVTSGCKEKELKAIVIHDSFGNFLRPYLSQHFSSVIYINSMNFEGAKALIEREHPDIVIDQRVARRIHRSVLPDPELEQHLLADKFELMPPALITVDRTNWEDFVFTSQKTDIRETVDGLNLSFSGQDAAVHLLFDKIDPLESPLVIKIDLSSEHPSRMRFCSALKGNAGELLRKQCEERDLDEGANLVFFRLYNPQPPVILELTPEDSGSFTLQSLRVKQELSPEQAMAQ
jgi:hypothetical protein